MIVGKTVLPRGMYISMRNTLTYFKEFRHLAKRRSTDWCIEVNQPLVLISQIQRSGGTLLSQLFDGHSQCHAHPYELYIGHPRKYDWPELNLDDKIETWFEVLQERPAVQSFENGYSKYSENGVNALESFPFAFSYTLQQNIFRRYLQAKGVIKERDILNAYMTSYFNAWLDNQNLYGGDKRYITGFVPRMNMDVTNIDHFFTVYPHGKFISLIRDPKSWFVSARKHQPHKYDNMEHSIAHWLASTEAALAIQAKYPQSTCLISFEQLLTNLQGTMYNLCDFLGIDFEPTLLTPTFNHFTIKADSSFKVQTHGIIDEPLKRYQSLTPQETSYIETQTETIIEAVRGQIVTPPSANPHATHSN